jgi:hypothetical protein
MFQRNLLFLTSSFLCDSLFNLQRKKLFYMEWVVNLKAANWPESWGLVEPASRLYWTFWLDSRKWFHGNEIMISLRKIWGTFFIMNIFCFFRKQGVKGVLDINKENHSLGKNKNVYKKMCSYILQVCGDIWLLFFFKSLILPNLYQYVGW